MGYLRSTRTTIGGGGGGGPAAPTPYSKGWPGDPTATVEPNVVAQWLFEEASGNIVDSVAALSVTANGGTGIRYEVPATQYSTAYTKSIAFDFIGSAARFSLTGNVPAVDFGTSDVVLEWVSNHTNFDLGCVFDTTNGAFGQGFRAVQYVGFMRFFIANSVGTTSSWDVTLSPEDKTHRSGQWTKHRVVFDRTLNNIRYYCNGVLQNTRAIASFNTWTVNSQNLFIGATAASASRLPGALAVLRLTVGNSTNNMGGPNGG